MKDFADKMTERFTSIDILINNASNLIKDLEYTPQAIEKTMSINCIGPAVLTDGLLKSLLRSNYARIINVYTEGYVMGTNYYSKDKNNNKDLDDHFLMKVSAKDYKRFYAYFKAKLNTFHVSRSLSDMVEQKRYRNLKVVTVSPSTVDTNFARFLPNWQKAVKFILDPIIWFLT